MKIKILQLDGRTTARNLAARVGTTRSARFEAECALLRRLFKYWSIIAKWYKSTKYYEELSFKFSMIKIAYFRYFKHIFCKDHLIIASISGTSHAQRATSVILGTEF